jgi:hypothetical protein
MSLTGNDPILLALAQRISAGVLDRVIVVIAETLTVIEWWRRRIEELLPPS